MDFSIKAAKQSETQSRSHIMSTVEKDEKSRGIMVQIPEQISRKQKAGKVIPRVLVVLCFIAEWMRTV